ncbi:TPA: fimbrial biogenesis outer membrane usher protein [Escherichia coli]|nr:fimbrial biogenesis outer membrane usher protein [Escherichia coli]HAV9967644.1 fimbrial biogenesis outer membrane usher protein [Escherichia coli]HCJ9730125.1 fimbrial biogenesis outer membrane usher protein [Escherichia coli]HCJ9730376.1 fimbrial biogenesis outer membrane usher protein [Escherichia coli]HCJ9743966.1 fimbrial biogenesis outer membrane usher protein [Escherichia coli]
MPDHSLFRLRVLPWYIALAISGSYASAWADDDIQFDSRFLELKGDTKIDLKRFSSQGYVEPGKYNLQVQVNKQPLPDDHDIFWYASEKEAGKTYACLTPALLAQFGLKEDIAKSLQWSRNGECLAPGQLEGIDIKADLSQSALLISLPQAYLEYSDIDWDPPSRWDDGIPGLIADYSINAQTRHDEQSGDDSNDISGNGTVGANLGPWRLRADWQTDYQHTRSGDDDEDSDGNSTQRNWEWSRYYAWRALPSLKAKLALGEDYLNSDIFDGFNYVGGSVSTEDQMLPPNLRGYAPDISGVAHTTAKVTVSQMGRVIYETQVPAGPFRIQDLGDSVSGTLHVRIEEQNGQVQEYDISTASMPFLTRQGQVRYKVMMGRPQEWGHNIVGGFFSGGEASWGIANGWSLYGGALADENYQSAAIGVGRDLSVFGAMAFDVTHSHVRLDENTAYDNRTLDGNSFRVSYAKDFDELDSRVTFAGYRFSEKNYMTMSEYLDAKDADMVHSGNDKEMYTVTYNQNFRDAAVSVYLNYTHRTYWDRPEQTNYNVMMSHYFNMGSIRNMSVSLTSYRYEYDKSTDKGMYISLSMPWGDSSTVSYNGNYGSGSDSSQVGYFSRIDDASHYQINVGTSENHGSVDGYYSRDGSLAKVDLSANYHEGEYQSAGISLQGGATLTAHGGALHRTQNMGGTRLLIDADGVSGVLVEGNGSPVYTNMFGKAVVADVNNYYRNQAYIDITKLPENAEATQSVVQATLTEGAIGYRHFAVISGQKAMAVLRLSDGSHPPFGAEVKNSNDQQVGLVDDDGNVYLAGVNAGERMTVSWEGAAHCDISLPDPLPADLFNGLLLPCQTKGAVAPATSPDVKPVIQEQTQRVTPTEPPTSISVNQ